MKKAFAGSSVQYGGRFPKGCFFISNKFYYNKGKTGKANKGASPVCVTTVAAAPKKKLVLAAKGKLNCAGKGTPVKNENACKSAAKAMKKAFAGSSVQYGGRFPKGCFFISNKFYYNKGKTG